MLAVSLLAALVGALVVLAPASPASAKGAYDSAYGFDRTWNAGLRLVRVDLGLKVTEKDDANGPDLLFDYKSPESGQKPVPARWNAFRAKGNGRVRVDAVVRSIAQMPATRAACSVESAAAQAPHRVRRHRRRRRRRPRPERRGPDSDPTP